MGRSTLTWSIAALFAATIVVGCGDSSNPPTAPGELGGSGDSSGGSGNSPAPGGIGTGTVSLAITDSPFTDAKAVLVTFNEVSVHRSEGDGWETIAFAGGATKRTCDLKKLQGPTDLLGVATLPAGHYTQIRLTVESAAIYFDTASATGPCATTIAEPAGDKAPVEVSSGSVKLNREFTLESGGVKQITLDFDGDKSIHQTGGGGRGGNGNGRGNAGSGDDEEESTGRYIMNPVISVVSVQ